MAHRETPIEQEGSRLRNKYRRAFSWRLSEPSENRQSKITGAIRLSLSEYPDILEDYLYVSRKRRNNATAIAQLQMQLLQELAVQEQAIKHYKANQSTDSAEREFVDSQIFHHRLISNAVRQIGDGIAWREFRYDRSVPRILSEHPVKQVILAEGIVAELNEWSSIFYQASRRAIINAITNCIAIGDITAVDEDGGVELIEVKSGKTKSSRKIRQKNQLKRAAGILDTGFGLIDGRQVKIASMPLHPKNHLAELKDLLEECGNKGWSSRLVAPHCYVECVDFRKLGDLKTESPKMEEVHRLTGEEWGSDKISVMSSMEIITFAPNLAPFSIFPFDDRTCIELAIGAKSFRTFLNMSEVIRAFERSGWTSEGSLEDALDKTKGEAVAILKKGGFLCHLPPGDFGRLQFEMLNPESLLEQCEYIRSLGPGTTEYGVWTLDGEGEQWN